MPIGTTNFPTSLDTVVELVEVADNALTTLTAILLIGATTASVASTTSFPTTGILTIEDEKISYTGKTATSFTGLTRGVGNTSAAEHASATNVEILIVEDWHRVHSAAIIAIETRLTAGNITANTVYSGPGTGAAASPAFRALVAADIPDLSAVYSPIAHTHTFASLNSTPTTLAGYGITDAQPLDADLTAIAALSANGLLRKSAGTWAMDTATYLTANQTITLSGDVTGSGTTAITTTIAAGAVTNAMLAGSIAISKLSITGTPDATKFLRDDGSWQAVPSGGITALTGDVTASGSGSVVATIAAGVVTNAMLAGSIAYSKLSLTGAILNADLAGSIAYSKLSLTGAILNADLAGSIAITKITMNTARLLGRTTASAGAVEELSLGYGLAMASGVLRTAVPSVVVLTDGATVSVDATLRGPYRLTLGGNRTLANPTGAVDGQIMTFEFIQDATGSRTITLDTKFIYGADITAVVLSTAANKRDFMTVQYNSSLDKFAVIAFTKTYA